MKPNRREFIKKMNWALAGIIGMLGFGGCEKDSVAVYTAKGTVINKGSGKPIEGIQVEFGSPYLGIVPMYGTIGVPYTPKAHVLTNVKGEFELTDCFHDEEFLMINNNRSLLVTAKDVDGEKNGLFHQIQLVIDTSNAEYYHGEYKMTVNIELTENKNE